ncbi:hypothetical protein AB0M29_23380 [Streptomyces sp. NPDC051976]|uniref:SCO6745 family protein n=1 Tax=Streptomyces sp. NPDC051976 TaxID=3154947 RepID=UPI00344164E6
MDEVWRFLECVHAPVYFAPEAHAAYSGVGDGLKGYWMGYFASRSAALGVVPAPVVTAAFYNFAAARVHRAVPDCWSLATPGEVLDARLGVARQALRRLLGDLADDAAVAEAAALARRAVDGAPVAGRALFAAQAAVPTPDEPPAALWWAATALREFRGDGHAAALLTAGIDGCEANVLTVQLGMATDEQREYRGWTTDEWAAATDRLRTRGWLAADGTPTAEGRAARDAVEATTERLARPGLAALGDDGTRRLADLLRPLARRIVDGGGLPFPNPMGMPPIEAAEPSA